MGKLTHFWKENRLTLLLASPMIANQLSQVMMGWADTVMVARLGKLPLAACAFATLVAQFCMVFGFGLVSSVSITVSRAFGAKQHSQAGEYLWSGTVLGLGVGLVMAVAIQMGMPWMHLLGQDPEVISEGREFLALVAWSIVPMILAIVWKDYSEALSRPWLPFWIMMGGVGVNVLLNWVLIFGHLGAPAMGLTGAGIATLISRIIIALALGWVIWRAKRYQPFRVPRIPWEKCQTQVRELFSLGWPTGLHLLSEVGLFCTASLMMGWLGVNALAAHQVAITCAATAFMVPLGTALAVTVRVGQAVGARELGKIRIISFGALAMGLVFMACFAAAFLLGGEAISQAFFATEPQVAALAASLLVVAGLFGVFDAAQIIGMGGLRGLADVRVPMVFVYVAYWGVGLPVSYYLGFHTPLKGVGIWIGLLVGLALVSVAILVRLWMMSQRERLERNRALMVPQTENEFAL